MRAISQVAGWVLKMEAATFLAEMNHPGPLRDLIEDYVQALFGQISQAAACNRLHSNEERLSRWLLMSHDRVGVDDFAITHEFLGQMLGSRRATVTLSAGILQSAGLITYRRGQVSIVDRPGLELVSCECYAVIKVALDGVLTKAAKRYGTAEGAGRRAGVRAAPGAPAAPVRPRLSDAPPGAEGRESARR